MKKLMILSTAALLITGVSFANEGGKGHEKNSGGKEKAKKEKYCTKSCPGKECGKKKG